jgi:hypothetical protein
MRILSKIMKPLAASKLTSEEGAALLGLTLLSVG